MQTLTACKQILIIQSYTLAMRPLLTIKYTQPSLLQVLHQIVDHLHRGQNMLHIHCDLFDFQFHFKCARVVSGHRFFVFVWLLLLFVYVFPPAPVSLALLSFFSPLPSFAFLQPLANCFSASLACRFSSLFSFRLSLASSSSCLSLSFSSMSASDSPLVKTWAPDTAFPLPLPLPLPLEHVIVDEGIVNTVKRELSY